MDEEAHEWHNAAIEASNLSQTELVFGDVARATTTGETSVVLATRAGAPDLMAMFLANHADALHAAGEWEKAAGLFADAERRQKKNRPEYPLLYSMTGYHYCDLLLALGQAAEARDRAAQTLEWARPQNWVLDIALDTLTLGRAHHALAFQSLTNAHSAEAVRDDACAAGAKLDEAIENLRASGHLDFIPPGMLAHARFRRALGDWDGAARDFDEVEEIAEPGPMRLYLCDRALERARLALAQREAFAPLNGLVEPTPPPPAPPDPAEAARLLEEARKELDAARKLIAECGYHRRDEELAELDAVVADRCRFADLPPRV